MDRGTIFLALAVVGTLAFMLCSPALFSLISSGPAYDTTSTTGYRLRRGTLIPFQRQIMYPTVTYLSFPDFASLPMTNYTIKGSVSGNSSLGVLVLDTANYNNFVGSVPCNPIVSAVSSSGENRTFELKLDQSKSLYLVITRSSPQYSVLANIVVYYEYYEQVIETTAFLSITKTVILPAASVIGLILLIFSFLSLRSMAKTAREEAERRQLYMAVSESGSWPVLK